MRAIILSLTVLAVSTGVSARPQTLDREYCGTRHPDEATAVAIDQEVQRSKGRTPQKGSEVVTVDVYFHVVTSAAGEGARCVRA